MWEPQNHYKLLGSVTSKLWSSAELELANQRIKQWVLVGGDRIFLELIDSDFALFQNKPITAIVRVGDRTLTFENFFLVDIKLDYLNQEYLSNTDKENILMLERVPNNVYR